MCGSKRDDNYKSKPRRKIQRRRDEGTIQIHDQNIMYPFCVSHDIQNKVPKEAIIIIRGHHHQTQFYFHFDINSLHTPFVSFAVLFTKNNGASLTSRYEVLFPVFKSLYESLVFFSKSVA